MESATKLAEALSWGDPEGLPQQGFLSRRTFPSTFPPQQMQTEPVLTCPSSSFRSEVFTNAPSFISSSYISLSQEMKKEPKNFCISTVTYMETGIMKLKRTINDKKSVNIRKTCNGNRRRCSQCPSAITQRQFTATPLGLLTAFPLRLNRKKPQQPENEYS